ncbi:hypothetical protein HC762_01460 [bacterium]|nr:hypothetical protein [bacterium]
MSNDSVRFSWMRIDRLAFGILTSELLGRFLLFSPSDSDVFVVKDSFEVVFRNLAVDDPRFACCFAVLSGFSFNPVERPTEVAVEFGLF